MQGHVTQVTISKASAVSQPAVRERQEKRQKHLSLLLSRISNDSERQAYVKALPSAQAALERLAIEAGLSKR
jgi:hypothetical protein